ncbi:MAG TPA: TRAP transporter large permease [Casimicrobiaceae bacterium]|nr:TRAP transporter large permease [Casimicrobiaceae bacterium]
MIDQTVAGLVIVALLGGLLILGMPIGFSLAASGIAGLVLTRGWGPLDFLVGSFSYSYVGNLGYIVLPLFLFMGHMTFVSGVSERAYAAGQRLFGHVAGGLAIATIMASAAFAMVCGSSAASASTMGKIAIPEMLKRGYARSLTAGSVAGGGTLGILIPPSGVLVVYSIATETSILDLFVAAFIPGVITTLVYVLLVHGMVRLRPALAGKPLPRAPVADQLRALASSWEIILLFIIVMGGIYLGVATATEAAAVGALVATLLVFRQKGNRTRMIGAGLLETGSATATIFLLILGAGLFSTALSTTQIPNTLATWAVQYSQNRYVVLLLILLAYFVLGMFIDGFSMILLTMPIVFPIVTRLHFDAVWFGIIVTKTVEIGLLTPPVGLNAFVVKSVAPEIPLGEIFRGCFPFVLAEIAIVALLVAFPEVTQVLRAHR